MLQVRFIDLSLYRQLITTIKTIQNENKHSSKKGNNRRRFKRLY
jgi:hypothetical protein